MSDFRPDIWRLQAQFDTQGLIDALRNEDAGIRKRAAAALRALGATSAIPALKTALEKEPDADTRSNILAALAALEHEKERIEEDPATREVSVVDALIGALNSPDPDQVIDAAAKLGDMRNKRAVEPLVMMFNNGKMPVKVRLAVAEALLKLESAPVEVALLGALRSSQWRIRRNGAAILGQLKAEWAIEPLTVALRDENDLVRKTARAALRYINTPEARAALDQVKDIDEQPEPKRPLNSSLGARPASPTLKPPRTSVLPSPKSDTIPSAPVKPAEPPKSDTGSSAPTKPVESPKADTLPSAPVKPAQPPKSDTLPSTNSAKADTLPSAPTRPVESPTEAPKTETDSTGKRELADWEVPTRMRRPEKIAWPKRVITSEDPTQIQTRPLDPKKAEEAEPKPPDNSGT